MGRDGCYDLVPWEDETRVKDVGFVSVLPQNEEVRLDPDQLEALYDELGEAGAEDVVCRAMEELAVRLSVVERLYRQDRTGEMRKAVRSLSGIADQIGMRSLRRVGCDVIVCIDNNDPVALAATLTRLLRIGERSLTEIWEIQGLRI